MMLLSLVFLKAFSHLSYAGGLGLATAPAVGKSCLVLPRT